MEQHPIPRMPHAIPPRFNDWQSLGELGKGVYRSAMGEWFKPGDERWDDMILAVARIFWLAFERMGPGDLDELRGCLEGRGPFTEPAFVEPLEIPAAHHLHIDEQIENRQDTRLVELLTIANDTEVFVRPGLLRLLWAAESATAEASASYSDYQLNDERREGSVKYALNHLRSWRRQQPNAISERKGGEEFDDFIVSLSTLTGESIGMDQLRNWVFHRSFVLVPDGVLLGLHPPPGELVLASTSQVTGLRRSIGGLLAIFLAFGAMFQALAANRIPGLEPGAPRPGGYLA
jgi:hypothetical protein